MDLKHSPFHDWKEWRRMRALCLQQQGWTQRAIADALGVSEQAVSQWIAAARRGGPDALRTRLAGPPG
jgi:transposase